MKKVLMLCFLLVAIAGATPALAAPFAFGPSTFDDQAELLDNLKTLVPSGSGNDFDVLPNNDILGSPAMYVKLIGLSSTMTAGDSYFTANDGNDYFADSRDLSGHWNADSTQHNLEDIWVKFQRNESHSSVSNLEAILKGLTGSGITAVGAYYFGGDAVVYQPDGYAPITLYGGTTFIGISFLGSNASVDAILALSYLPMNAVPVPAAVWLLGSGLAGIVALRKRMA